MSFHRRREESELVSVYQYCRKGVGLLETFQYFRYFSIDRYLILIFLTTQVLFLFLNVSFFVFRHAQVMHKSCSFGTIRG